jgi:hypothetical protein
MRTDINEKDSPVEMPMELARRTGDGIDVLLLWDRSDDRITVVVDDLRAGGSFELVAGDGKQALDAFYHPFAHAAARGIAYRSGQGLEGVPVESEVAGPVSPPR